MNDNAFASPWPSVDSAPKITAVRAIVTAPEGIPLVVVRVDTSEAGLVGYGCATFTQRWRAVAAFIEDHVAPLIIGRCVADIEDLTALCRLSGYWRDGPVGNNAISGIDMALWDIAGKRAGLPVYQLLGGRARAAVPCYTHAGGASIAETLDQARGYIEDGWRHIRIQVASGGIGAYGGPGTPSPRHQDAPYPAGWDPREYLRVTPGVLARARTDLGPDIELLHDVHSRLTPKEAIQLARAVEDVDLFFLEDVVAPENFDHLPWIRSASPVPIAVGELTTSLRDAVHLVRDGGVDVIRSHISFLGGLTPARKLAALAELSGVRTAWHGPGDTSPIGTAANVALEVSSPAFGIHESHVYPDPVHEVFPGTMRIERGWIRPTEAPGWGIEVDEAAAARFPAGLSGHDAWAATVRRPDGSLIAP